MISGILLSGLDPSEPVQRQSPFAGESCRAQIYDTCPDTYIRPDHGRMIWDEIGRPGYGLYDRALGATYLNGLWEAIDKNAKASEK